MKITFFGLGNMGLPMARNLGAAGFVLKGYDIRQAGRVAAGKAGVVCCDTLDDSLKDADVLITMLPDGDCVRDVLLNDKGVLRIRPHLIMDCSTIAVEMARTLGRVCRDNGVMWLDAPVSGGITGADAATLTFMCGGVPAALAYAKPLLEYFLRLFHFIGEKRIHVLLPLLLNFLVRPSIHRNSNIKHTTM
ncbi:MAG: NAD(P)-binding domain-containing protein, partial [Pseudomonadota bacterium]